MLQCSTLFYRIATKSTQDISQSTITERLWIDFSVISNLRQSSPRPNAALLLPADVRRSVRKMLDLALPDISNYPVHAVPTLPHWTHASGRFTLIGDAAHAMAFYMSMGVSLAVEDAAALAKALELTCPPPTVVVPETVTFTKGKRALREPVAAGRLLRLFESVRRKRVHAVQRASQHAGDSIHVEEGKERDMLYETLSHENEDVIWPPLATNEHNANSTDMSPNEGGWKGLGAGGIGDKESRDLCYAYDAISDIQSSWILSNTSMDRS